MSAIQKRFFHWVSEEFHYLLEFKESQKLWHAPFLAAACVGIPLLGGYYTNHFPLGLLSCTGALVILYMPKTRLHKKMITLLLCSLGFALSFAFGLALGLNSLLSAFILTAFSFSVNFIVNRIQLHPPGSLLFIMINAIAICMPYDPATIPAKVSFLGLGSLLSCLLALVYHVLLLRDIEIVDEPEAEKKSTRRNLMESGMLALFTGLSLAAADLLHLQKPYWIPISCAAVMQGNDLRHVWQRSFQRFVGTVLGLGIAWILLNFHFNILGICIAIIVLQFVADIFISRHYALVVVFFTPVAIFLAEAGSALQAHPDHLIRARLLDTLIGCCIGAIGGFLLHRQIIGKERVIP